MAWMIERSSTAPLSFTTNYETDVDASKLTLISSHLYRFKSLALDFPSRGVDTFFEAFNQSVPLLQQLDITDYNDWAFAFPPKFLSGGAPNLRHISLTTNSGIPWDSELFSNLTTLEVFAWGPGSYSRDGFSLNMLLSALARMPELETLTLRRCFSLPTPLTAAGAHIDLSNLKQLEVRVPLEHCTCFLRQITISASATVLLEIESSESSREDVEEFFTVFPSHLYATSTAVAQALRFSYEYDPDYFKVDVCTVQQNTEHKNSRNAGIKLAPHWRSSSPTVKPLDLVWACFAALASPQLRSFRIWGDDIGWNSEVWRRVARATPNLRRLAVDSEEQSAELFKALSLSNVPDPVLADCPFPALSYLELVPPYGRRVLTPDGKESPLSVDFAWSLATRASIGCSTLETRVH
ncbi:hypothetical protein BD779DRAFT_1038688 [Infundibulicybe gibba]|nr:hypothetical protein BD779DRAFT_1038688 [Infundibulicybe gibba]